MNFSKDDIRTSLKASTLDGVCATIFSNITGGVLLNNFLVELNANPVEIGMLASIPMLANLLQPLGAYLSECTTSRRNYNLCIFGTSRLLWLILAIGICLSNRQLLEPHQLIIATLAIIIVTHVLGAFGSASWLSWLATIVPPRLRGRYFGFRNSAINLTNLIGIPLAGWLISTWRGGSFQGYGVVLMLGILLGILSLAFQYFMVDVNPQEQKIVHAPSLNNKDISPESILKDFNFLMFLLYFGSWMFAINLSTPFFNLYMLDNLKIDVRYVTLYSSLFSGAYVLMLILWGKLSDRIGNRPILILMGILVAIIPLLWLGTGTNDFSVWLWIPLLHLLTGATGAAIELCTNNLQLGIAPKARQSSYFALVAAIGGVSGALGTTAGGFLAQIDNYGGLNTLFALSGGLRLIALMPLLFVYEQQARSLLQVMGSLLPLKLQAKSVNS